MAQNYLRFPAAPNLPYAPGQYESRYHEQLNNVLRLYFNQLSAALQQLSGSQGGSNISFPYGAFHQDGSTTLSTGISNVSTTPINVASTAGFPSSGWILIGNEIIQYTTKTATTFDGTITRGTLGTTNVAHSAGANITEVQGTGSSTTIGVVRLNNTDYSNGVYVDTTDDTKLYFDKSGIYNIQFSAQLLNFTTTEDNVTFWLAQNGTDVSASAGIEQVNSKHGTDPGARIAAWNYFQQVTAGDYIQLRWSSDTGNTAVATYPVSTSPVHPLSPALILTAAFVSAV